MYLTWIIELINWSQSILTQHSCQNTQKYLKKQPYSSKQILTIPNIKDDNTNENHRLT